MSEPKIARDAAELELDIWCETLEYKPSTDDREKLLSALMAGRITFDAPSETFTYRLRTPIELENHTTLSEMKVADVTAGQFAKAFKSIKVRTTGEQFAEINMEALITQVSDSTNQPAGVVQRVKQRDFSILQALMGFFG